MKVGKQTGATNRGDWTTRAEDLFSRPLIIGLLLVAVPLLVYWPARGFDFLGYDDPLYFTQNAHVLGGLTWSNFVWAFTASDAANWHPLTWLSLMLDAEIFGNQPAGPHLVNLLFHSANTVLVFVLFRRMTAAVWRSAFVAALFALHPLHVESVSWVAERKDLLCGFFVLLALLAYARYAMRDECCMTKTKAPASRITHHASRFYFLSLFLFALALMSKPMAVTLPFLFLLLDWWPLQRTYDLRFTIYDFKPLLLEKIPFFALSFMASLVTYLVQSKGDAVATLMSFSLSVRIENAFVSYARYLGKTIWPAALANPYPYPEHWPVVAVILSTLLVGVCCGAAFLCARRFPFLFTGWFWFAGMLVPVIGLVQVGTQAMADRYTYLPSIGLFVALVWGLTEAAARWKLPKQILTLCVLALLAASAVRTRQQLSYWQNDFTLFSHTLAVTDGNLVAHVNLGTWFSSKGQTEEALEQCHAALRLKPSDPLVLYDLGNAFAALGNFDEAVREYRRALELAPGRPNILNNLGCALMAQAQLPDAITNFEAALKAKPDFAYAHNSLATALFKQGRFDQATEHYYAAVKLAPGNPQFAVNLGDSLVRLGKVQAAAEYYQHALQLEPGNVETQAKLNSLGAHPGK